MELHGHPFGYVPQLDTAGLLVLAAGQYPMHLGRKNEPLFPLSGPLPRPWLAVGHTPYEVSVRDEVLLAGEILLLALLAEMVECSDHGSNVAPLEEKKLPLGPEDLLVAGDCAFLGHGVLEDIANLAHLGPGEAAHLIEESFGLFPGFLVIFACLDKIALSLRVVDAFDRLNVVRDPVVDALLQHQPDRIDIVPPNRMAQEDAEIVIKPLRAERRVHLGMVYAGRPLLLDGGLVFPEVILQTEPEQVVQVYLVPIQQHLPKWAFIRTDAGMSPQHMLVVWCPTLLFQVSKVGLAPAIAGPEVWKHRHVQE
jgi:hypothetical protein